MGKHFSPRPWAVIGIVLVTALMTAADCRGADVSASPAKPAFPITIVKEPVTVGGGGGSGKVSFSGNAGWVIRIALTATDEAIKPYGFLESRPGTGEYQPPLQTANNGRNRVEVTLTETGSYSLTVFDGTNKGGDVLVVIDRTS